MGARYGWGRHRQAWITVPCPECGQEVMARRAKFPWLHLRAHFTDAAKLCPAQVADVREFGWEATA